jgi:hypothetical protein
MIHVFLLKKNTLPKPSLSSLNGMDNFREARILLDTVLLGCYPAVDEANILEQSKSSGDEKERGMKDVDSMRKPNYPNLRSATRMP